MNRFTITDAFPLVYKGPGLGFSHDAAGQLCCILAAGRGRGPHNVALLFEDGSVLVTTRAFKADGKSGSCRKVRTKDLQLRLL